MGILKPLGTTSILVSPIALGTVKFGRNQGVKYPTAFDLPQDTDIKNLLSLCQELQINFLDTAAAYGLSEERIGKLLTHRQQWVISTKAGEEFQDGKSYYDFSPKHIRRSVERSLRCLKTDYLDLVLIHSDGNDEKIIHETDSLQTLHQLKEAGYIRALGMSTKTMAGGLQALTLCDAVMLSYNPLYTEELPVLEAAYAQQKGILIKKGLLSGHLGQLKHEDPIQHCLDFIFAQPAVTSLVVGTINSAHLQEISTKL